MASGKKHLNFYDVKIGKKFRLNDYKIVTRDTKGGKRKFAVAKSPKSGIEMWRIVSMDFKPKS